MFSGGIDKRFSDVFSGYRNNALAKNELTCNI